MWLRKSKISRVQAFEKIEQIAELDDTMTYAPEIQSIEIPPDQASENSENLQEYFDQVAAECTNVFKVITVLQFCLPIAQKQFWKIHKYSSVEGSVSGVMYV